MWRKNGVLVLQVGRVWGRVQGARLRTFHSFGHGVAELALHVPFKLTREAGVTMAMSGGAMRPTRLSGAAAAAIVGALFAVGSAAHADNDTGTGIDIAVSLATWATQHVNGIVLAAYDRAPALVMVLAALFVVPLTALIALVGESVRAHWSPPRPLDLAPTAPATPWPSHGWLTVDGPSTGAGTRTPLPARGGMIRIGRHEDNDVRLSHVSVHRHHALLHRTPEEEFVIVDLSGRDGNGVLVNGERLAEARLFDGDRIALGEVNLRFESAPI
jgi:hypothetical protein